MARPEGCGSRVQLQRFNLIISRRTLPIAIAAPFAECTFTVLTTKYAWCWAVGVVGQLRPADRR